MQQEVVNRFCNGWSPAAIFDSLRTVEPGKFVSQEEVYMMIQHLKLNGDIANDNAGNFIPRKR